MHIYWYLVRPVAFKEPGPNDEIRVDYELTENPLLTWKKLEEMVAKGKVRNIGVSKYGPLFVLVLYSISLMISMQSH